MYTLKHYLLVAVMTLVLIGTGIVFLREMNHEFLIYVVVVVALGSIIAATHPKVRYPFPVLVALTVWGIFHLFGGAIKVNGDVLYGLILFPISDEYSILRYDQVVHAWGFGTATLVMYVLIANLISPKDRNGFSVAILVIMSGIGLGALNETVEFVLTVILPKTGVGGYINTSLDLCSNLVGAIIAYILVRTGFVDMEKQEERAMPRQINK